MSGLSRWCFPLFLWDYGPRCSLFLSTEDGDFSLFVSVFASPFIFFLILTSVTAGLEIGLIFKALVKCNCHPLEDK